MDNKFLDKVVDQILSETMIDYDMGKIQFPFSSFSFSFRFSLFLSPISSSFFSDHCKDIYGLNIQEIEYVWKEYNEIIKDKISQ